MTQKPIDIPIRAKDETKKGFKPAEDGATRFGRSLKTLAIIGGGTTLMATGLARGLGALTRAMSSSLTAAKGQLEAETRLAGAFFSTGKKVDENVQKMRVWSAEIQNATGVGDEFTMGVAALIQQMGKASIDTTQRATEAIVDWSEATGRGATEGARILGRALSGLSVGWADLGVNVDRSLPPQQQAIQAISELEMRYGGFSRTIGGTAIGSLRKFDAALGDLQETFGLALVKTNAFNNILDMLGFHLGAVDQQVRSSQMAEILDGFFETVIRGSAFAAKAMLRFGEVVANALAGVLDALGMLAKSPAFQTIFGDRSGDAAGVLGLSAEAAAAFAFDMREAIQAVDDWADSLTRANERAAALREGGTGIPDGATGGGGTSAFGDLGAAISSTPQVFQDIASLDNAPMEHLLDLVYALRDELGELPFSLEALAYSAQTFADEVGFYFASIIDTAANGVGGLLIDFADKTTKTSEALRKMGETMKNAVLGGIGRAFTKVVLAPLDLALQMFSQWLTQLLFGAALEKQLQATAAAATIAISLPLAAAMTTLWAPVATLAAIATLGAASATGATSVLTALSTIKAATIVPGLAEGGVVSAPTLSVVGEGRYPEAVSPIRPGSALEQLSRAGGAEEFFGSGQGGGVVIDSITINVQGSVEDPNGLANEISQQIAEQLTYRAGRRFA